MTVNFKSRQRGLSFLGVLVIGSLLAGIGVVGAQIVPTVIEYQAVIKAVNKAREGSTVAEIRSVFDKAAAIDNIASITSKDLDVTKDGERSSSAFPISEKFT